MDTIHTRRIGAVVVTGPDSATLGIFSERDLVRGIAEIGPSVLEQPVSEVLVSNLLKSNCLVTGQPDWGSVQISYTGPQIDQAGLLRYIVSFRNHNEFHEQCVERIYMDVMARCKPTKLAVYARYTRRGGLDINPWRASPGIVAPASMDRELRQ